MNDQAGAPRRARSLKPRRSGSRTQPRQHPPDLQSVPFADTGRGRDTTRIQVAAMAHGEHTFTAGWFDTKVRKSERDMKIDLSGNRAVVTGSTSGIGFAITRGLAEAGAAVVINGCSQKNIDGATRRLHEHVPQAKVEGIAADLANAAGIGTFVARVGAADIPVNNLGIFEPKPFADISGQVNVLPLISARMDTCLRRGRANRALPPSGLAKIFGDAGAVLSRHWLIFDNRLAQCPIRSDEFVPIVAVAVVEQFA
jgi:hypothetical protein